MPGERIREQPRYSMSDEHAASKKPRQSQSSLNFAESESQTGNDTNREVRDEEEEMDEPLAEELGKPLHHTGGEPPDRQAHPLTGENQER